jgi:hypothetical protein
MNSQYLSCTAQQLGEAVPPLEMDSRNLHALMSAYQFYKTRTKLSLVTSALGI